MKYIYFIVIGIAIILSAAFFDFAIIGKGTYLDYIKICAIMFLSCGITIGVLNERKTKKERQGI